MKEQKTAKEYIPFGEEWKDELMKVSKQHIISLYRSACLSLEEFRHAQSVQPQQTLDREKVVEMMLEWKEDIDEAGSAFWDSITEKAVDAICSLTVQPQTEGESAVEMVIKEEKRLANSTPPREQPLDRNQLKAIIERHINYSGQGSDAIHMDDLVDELSAAHPIDERRIRFEVDKYEQRYRVDYSVNMLIGNKLFSIRALSEADAENKMAFLKSSLRELEVDKEYLERPSKDDLKREAKAFIDLVADPNNGSPMGLSEETLIEWLATFADGLLPTKKGVDKGAEEWKLLDWALSICNEIQSIKTYANRFPETASLGAAIENYMKPINTKDKER